MKLPHPAVFSCFCFISFALTACATPAVNERAKEPSAMRQAQSLVGTWDTARQHESAPESLKRPPAAGNSAPWLDRQFGTFTPVSVPALTPEGGQAVYLVWRSGGPAGPISRQRLWVFRPSPAGLVMDFYTFKDPAVWTGPVPDFSGLKGEDVIGYGPACALPVASTEAGWQASIPSSCVITARSGRKMTLSATITATASTLRYEEAGLLEGGGVAFRVPGIGAYEFDRVQR